MNLNPLEKDIEKKVCDYAKARGCLCYKFTSPAKRSVPDRLMVPPQPREIFFIEFKRKGQVPTPGQQVEIEKLRAQGKTVFVIDNVATGKQIIDTWLFAPPAENSYLDPAFL